VRKAALPPARTSRHAGLCVLAVHRNSRLRGRRLLHGVAARAGGTGGILYFFLRAPPDGEAEARHGSANHQQQGPQPGPARTPPSLAWRPTRGGHLNRQISSRDVPSAAGELWHRGRWVIVWMRYPWMHRHVRVGVRTAQRGTAAGARLANFGVRAGRGWPRQHRSRPCRAGHNWCPEAPLLCVRACARRL